MTNATNSANKIKLNIYKPLQVDCSLWVTSPLIPRETVEACQICVQFIPGEPQIILGKDKKRSSFMEIYCKRHPIGSSKVPNFWTKFRNQIHWVGCQLWHNDTWNSPSPTWNTRKWVLKFQSFCAPSSLNFQEQVPIYLFFLLIRVTSCTFKPGFHFI